MRVLGRTFAGALLASVLFAGTAAAQQPPCRNTGSFDRWLDDFRAEAAAQGISPKAIAALDGIALDQSVLARDRGQGVFSLDFLRFSDRLITGARLEKGLDRLRQHRAILERVEERYGVPSAVIVAFWALETDFGAILGDFSTLRALATLAYDCRRPERFRPELMDALRLIERGDLKPSQMKGAWAGEMGQTQFLPSDYLESAVDFDGDGTRDLYGSTADVLASSGNFLQKLGWRRGEPWLEEVRIPENLDWKQADLDTKHPRSYWADAGVTYADGKPLTADALEASLHLPMGRLGPAFLAYPNFDIYREWNKSVVYVTTAAYLATRLAGAPPVRRGTATTLSADQVKELQRLLAARNQYDGEIDGRLGTGSRAGVKAAQIEFSLPADAWPNAELIARLEGR